MCTLPSKAKSASSIQLLQHFMPQAMSAVSLACVENTFKQHCLGEMALHTMIVSLSTPDSVLRSNGLKGRRVQYVVSGKLQVQGDTCK